MIFSQPFLPTTTGTPRQMSLWPYSPSSLTQQGINFFSSLTIVSTKAAPAAPGAYHAEVPNKPVNVAPPTIVSAATFFKTSLSNKFETGTLLYVAILVKGIMVVSPCPPITTPCRSACEQFNTTDK